MALRRLCVKLFSYCLLSDFWLDNSSHKTSQLVTETSRISIAPRASRTLPEAGAAEAVDTQATTVWEGHFRKEDHTNQPEGFHGRGTPPPMDVEMVFGKLGMPSNRSLAMWRLVGVRRALQTSLSGRTVRATAADCGYRGSREKQGIGPWCTTPADAPFDRLPMPSSRAEVLS
jgi:hypothetical protein